jgi:hypothetical protein
MSRFVFAMFILPAAIVAAAVVLALWAGRSRR